MQKYAALLSYVGTQYCGWQRQKGSAADGGPSIQSTIETAIRRMTSEEDTACVGSGRTDSGVHAVGQVAHFTLMRKKWECSTLERGLNSLLAESQIQVLGVKEVSIDFHAQRSAVKKQYSYYFQQGPSAIPAIEPYSWWIRKRLDLGALSQALESLRGEHDFKAFQARGAAPVKSTVRKILEAEVSLDPLQFPASPHAGLVRVRLVGTGFLKQMVRGIAGTLLQIGEGRRPASDMARILSSQDRKIVGPTAPARALWLERVWYEEVDWETS